MSETRWQWIGLVLAAVLVMLGVFLGAPAGHGPGFVVTLAATTPAGASTTLRYQASLSGSDRVRPGDFFRITAVPGYVDGSASAPAGWGATAVTSGGDATLRDLVFTYDGPAPINGPVLLNGFSVRSTSGDPRAARTFIGRSTRATGPDAGSAVGSSGEVRGPGAVPEPGSLALGTVGVMVLGVVYARRHRRMVRATA